jgi:hypothetical protein
VSSTGSTFFHVDRDGRLTEGQVLSLQPHGLTDPAEKQVIDSLLPKGVSTWGADMLAATPPIVLSLEALDNHQLSRPTQLGGVHGTFVGPDGRRALAVGRNRIIETIAETVRHGRDPSKPSRLACLYAYHDLDVAKRFRAEQGVPHAPIWKVHPDGSAAVHEADSRLLGFPDSIPQLISRAISYWDGGTVPGSTTTVEVLLPMPVTVGERAD